MTVRQTTKLLGEIPVHRVEGGDQWVDRANAELGLAIFHRSMTGEELMVKYNTLNMEQRGIADAAFELSDGEINELLDEVYRIREDKTENQRDQNKDSLLQASALLFSMFLTAVALIVVAFVIMASTSSKDIPEGYVFQMGKMLLQYFVNREF